MSDPELVAEIRLLAKSTTEMNDSVKKLVEAEIRRQERDTRQEELNIKTNKRLIQLEQWQHDLEIQRAKESQGRVVITKYWWVLLLVALSATSYITKTIF